MFQFLHTTQAEITINRKQSSAQAIKLHNFVVQSYNELLILDCASNRVRKQSSALAIKLHNFVVQKLTGNSRLR